MQSALSVYMGSEAAKTIGERGWQSAPFSTLIGASGGPKWLILSELDKVLGQALLLGRSEPMTLLGSSIGTWRHACLSLNDPERSDFTTATSLPVSGIQLCETFAH